MDREITEEKLRRAPLNPAHRTLALGGTDDRAQGLVDMDEHLREVHSEAELEVDGQSKNTPDDTDVDDDGLVLLI